MMEGAVRKGELGDSRAERKLSILVFITTALLLACVKVRPLLIVVLAIVGAAFVALLVLQPVAAVWVLTFFAYGQVSSAFFPGIFSALLVLASLAWIVRALLSSDSTISGTRVDLALLIYVCAMLMSMLFCSTPQTGGPLLLLAAKWLMFYALVVNLVRSQRAVVSLSMAVVGGAALSGLVGLWAFSQERWLVGLDAVFRAAGLVGDANEQAIVMVTAMPISAYMMGAVRNRFAKLVFAAIVLVLVGANLVTLSRTGLMAMLLVFLLIGIRERRRTWVRVSVAIFVIALPLLIPPEFWRRLGGGGFLTGDYSSYLRVEAMMAGLRMFAENPITGVGLGVYLHKSTQYGHLLFPLVAHNMYLHVLAESGIVGLAAMLFLIVSSLRSFRLAEAAATEGSPLRHLARGFRISYLAFLFCGLFTSIHMNQSFWFLPAVSVLLLQATRNQTSNQSAPQPGQR